MIQKGAAALSNAELIAILLGSGLQGITAVDLAKQLLGDHHNRLEALGKATLQELMQYKGIGEAKAITIAAALELGRRRQREEPTQRTAIHNSQDAYQCILSYFQDLDHERLMVMYLNTAAQVITVDTVFIGGLASTVVDVRIVFKKALDHRATSMIVAHNHPSGNLQPSQEDRRITRQLVEAGKVLSIPVRDHLIVTGRGYFSFADEGLLQS
ncbi:MAG: DNA repair protein RadC [Lewinellaceae bacterium]|nr:DNA repair protein RadC [Lewinellaceae bacterium]